MLHSFPMGKVVEYEANHSSSSEVKVECMELYLHVPYNFHGVVLIGFMGLCFPIHLYIHLMLEHFTGFFELLHRPVV
jgi:hypothetical protein